MMSLRGDSVFLTQEHRETIEIARLWLETLGSGDMDELMELWHQEGRLEFPFHPPGAHESVQGWEQLNRYFHDTGGYKKPLGFSLKAVYPCADPEWVIIEFTGNLIKTLTGERYSNEYLSVVQTSNGKVKSFREFFDSLKRAQYEARAKRRRSP